MKNQISKFFRLGLASIWFIIATYSVGLLLFLHQATNYIHKQNYILSHVVLLGIGCALLGVISYFYSCRASHIDQFFNKFSPSMVIRFSIIVFLVQAYVFWNIYFVTGWDPGTVNITAAYIASDGKLGWPNDWYYEIYPNNAFVTCLLSLLLKVGFSFGSTTEVLFTVVLFQCGLSCCTGIMLYQVVFNMTKATYAYFVWIIYVLHIAFNPWLMIPYTDALALFIPITILRLYQKSVTDKARLIYWFIIGTLAGFGYKIKPQSIIILIAIVLNSGITLISRITKETLHAASRTAGITLLAIVISLYSCNVFTSAANLPNNKETALGLTHFAMMGLNEDTIGAYNQSDMNYSMSFSTAKERSAANISTIQSRIVGMGIKGYFDFVTKKTLLNFSSGTYTWGCEGNFYWQVFDDRNEMVSPFLKKVFYTTGDYYKYYSTFQQMIWITLLLASSSIGLFKSRKNNLNICNTITLTLIGITLFQTIFEARTRYFFVNSPIIILAAFLGWLGIFERLTNIRINLISKLENNTGRKK